MDQTACNGRNTTNDTCGTIHTETLRESWRDCELDINDSRSKDGVINRSIGRNLFINIVS